jgi:hypothetical protein
MNSRSAQHLSCSQAWACTRVQLLTIASYHVNNSCIRGQDSTCAAFKPLCVKRCVNPLTIAQYQVNQAKDTHLYGKQSCIPAPMPLKRLLRSALTTASVCPLWLSRGGLADPTATSQGQPTQLRKTVAHITAMLEALPPEGTFLDCFT